MSEQEGPGSGRRTFFACWHSIWAIILVIALVTSSQGYGMDAVFDQILAAVSVVALWKILSEAIHDGLGRGYTS